MSNILVTGANGQLGWELRNVRNFPADSPPDFTDVDELDITDYKAVEKMFSKNKYEFAINAAAYTAVDAAETDEENARRINVYGVENLANICTKYNTKLIHISTDYVFDGRTYIPYTEESQVNPVSIYGKTKLEGEQKILENKTDAVIFRTSWLYSSHGNNFVKKILKYGTELDELKIVFDQIGTPTYAADLANLISTVIQKTNENPEIFKNGIYNYSNEGVASWYDFAFEIFEIADIYCNIQPVDTSQFTTSAVRPPFSVLDKRKVKQQFEIQIPHWRESLLECMDILMPQLNQRFTTEEIPAIDDSELNLEKMNK